MVNAGAYNTVDAQRQVGEPYRMGVNAAHNTIGKMLVPTTLFVSGRLQSTVSAGVHGTVPGIMVRLVRLVLLSPFVPWSFPGGRPRSVGPSRLWLRQSEKSGNQGFCVPWSETWG